MDSLGEGLGLVSELEFPTFREEVFISERFAGGKEAEREAVRAENLGYNCVSG